MITKFKELESLSAGEFDHLDGSLIQHLSGTKELLAQWGASQDLQDAGLYHAAYGTAAFNLSLVSVHQRAKISSIIGQGAEEIVYQYCACDRSSFFSQLRNSTNPGFPNRFTGKSYQLSEKMLKAFCELTAANEVEIAIDNPDFVNEHGKGLESLFKCMAPHLSLRAFSRVKIVFGQINT